MKNGYFTILPALFLFLATGKGPAQVFPPPSFGQRIFINEPPPLVIVGPEAGLTHDLKAFWSPGIIAPPTPIRPALSFRLRDAPAGMTLSAVGLLEWSLIDPPLGVDIDGSGYIRWQIGVGSTAPVERRMAVRAVYRSNGKTWSDEVTIPYTILAESPSSDRTGFRTPASSRVAGASLGWDLAHTGEWFAASEPGSEDHLSSGALRLWQKNEQGRWFHHSILQPHLQQDGQYFGASLAFSSPEADSPTLAVGAPGFHLPTSYSNGAVYLYNQTQHQASGALWLPGPVLLPPKDSLDLAFGASLDLDQDTLVVSAHGYRETHRLIDQGALFLYEQGPDNDWTRLPAIINPDDHPEGDAFGYPCAIEGEWIAVGATGDEGGSVYLYQKINSRWVESQKLVASAPEPDGQFGARIFLGDEWLFISSPTAAGGAGKVEVFRLHEGRWLRHQILRDFFEEPSPCFGAAIAQRHDTLLISAPGGFALFPDDFLQGRSDGRIMIFQLREDRWDLQRRTTESLGHHERPYWGHSLVFLGDHEFAASHPNAPYGNGGNPLVGAGEIHTYSWEDGQVGWQAYRQSLPPELRPRVDPGGDFDQNGLSNLSEWVYGLDPVSTNDAFSNFEPRFYRPLFDFPDQSSPRLLIPEFRRLDGIGFQLLSSTDLNRWSVVPELEWQPLREYSFPGPRGVRIGGIFQSISLAPFDEQSAAYFRLEFHLE